MASTRRLGLLLMLIFLVCSSTLASKNEGDFSNCESIVMKWAKSSTDYGVKQSNRTLKDLLFFLHIPRTGGRTYFHCFLKKLYVKSDECPHSYDKLHFDPREPKCRLLVTHDDYSLMSKLPEDKTSVVTILRNPADRIFSTYEFAVEVAARFLVHPNLTSAIQMSRRIASKSPGVSTLNIWPWKYLVPWMREDLFNRRDARRQAEFRIIKGSRNPYNVSELVMPLHAFIEDPMAHEIIHNGATFQVAGLTNNSYVAESPTIRHCVRRHPVLGRYILDVAKNRLDRMLYIGLTEDHKGSATIFANMVGSQVLSQSQALNMHSDKVSANETGMISIKDSEGYQASRGEGFQQAGEESSANSEKSNKMTVEKLMEAYEICIPGLRKSQAKRRSLSLRKIARASFSKEARLEVPESLIQKMLSLNNLDVDLYQHAQHLFMQQQKQLQNDGVKIEHLSVQGTRQIGHNLCGWGSTKLILLGLMTLIVIFASLILTKKRRMSKIKV